MNLRKLFLFFVTLILTIAVFAPVAHADNPAPGAIPIPTPTPRPMKPDLMFTGAICTYASNGGRLIFFTVKNNTLIGMGLASGNFNITVNGQWMPPGLPNSLAPQAARSYTRWVALPGWYEICLDPDHRVPEFNEGNNCRKVLCH